MAVNTEVDESGERPGWFARVKRRLSRKAESGSDGYFPMPDADLDDAADIGGASDCSDSGDAGGDCGGDGGGGGGD